MDMVLWLGHGTFATKATDGQRQPETHRERERKRKRSEKKTERERETERERGAQASLMPNDMVTAGNRAPQVEFA